MPTFAELKNQADTTSEVRKILEQMVWLAPITADPIDSLTDENGALKALPEGYWPVGIITTDGSTLATDVNVEDVEGFGYAQPVRRDITSATQTVTVTCLETFRKNVISLAYMMSLEDVEQALNGEIVFDRPSLPEKQFYRMIRIGRDVTANGDIYRAKFYPRVYSVSIPEEAWTTDAVTFPLELTPEVDKALGTAERNFIAGPGAKAAAASLGFKQGA
ncbi:MAG: hypothetical protein E7Z96_02670 [Actinomycetaceae bacterium]|nr:hypothetical protein [Actinomycetaceae bacterium]